MITDYKTESFFDEMFSSEGRERDYYRPLMDRMNGMSKSDMQQRKVAAEKALVSLGITFNVYGSEEKEERIIPFDIIPRILPSDDWNNLETGLKQRTKALNLFIEDIYNEQQIIKDGIVPKEYIYSSPSYLKAMEGFKPPKGIWIHISGTDLIRDHEGTFRVLEDNLRCPSGVSYVLENREVMKRTFPELFERLSIRTIYDYPIRLRAALEFLSERDQANCVVLTPGVFNSAYYEHSFLAHKMGIPLVNGSDLTVEKDIVYMKTTHGLERVDVIYRRIDDDFLDPDAFNPESVLGVAGLFSAYKKGNVALVNAPGTGVADDKVIYAFVPEIIQYYLGEEAVIPNVPTYLCYRDEDCKYVMENIEKLVVKAANGAGGYGMLIGPASTKQEQSEFRAKIKENPRNYIAQPVISLSRVPTMVDSGIEGRHVDLRPFIIYGDDISVMPGGLTRVALKKGSLVVNSSQGGGTKDTWVMGG